MANYTLDVSINRSDFPEIGTPNRPEDPKDIAKAKSLQGFRTEKRKEYEYYYDSINRGYSSVVSGMTNSYHNNGFVNSRDTLSFSLPYESGVPNTYKFLGMDINNDYQAVIPVGDGYVVVEEMFDPDKILSVCNSDVVRRFDPNDVAKADDVIKTCSSKIARKVSTAMKTGKLYDIYQDSKEGKGYVDLQSFLPFVDMVKEDVFYNGSVEEALSFKSILLNLVHEVKQQQSDITGVSEDQNYSNVAIVVLSKLFYYWEHVIEVYNGVHSLLSEVDLWQSMYKSFIGDDEFNSRIKNSMNIINASTGEIVNGIASVSGVARNGDLNDANLFRSSSSSSLRLIRSTLNNSNYQVSLDDMQDLLYGNIDYEKFDNPYDLTPEEVQAVSNYDSLRNVDDDAKTCIESYNMDDPDERALFLKSAIRSYERNFREYKPSNNYDVTEAMSNLIENGERFKDRIVSDSDYDGEDSSVYVVTATNDELKLNVDKRSILRVAKLIDKELTAIQKLF